MPWTTLLARTFQMLVSGGFVVAGITAVWALATLSFRLFESPFLKLKGRFHD